MKARACTFRFLRWIVGIRVKHYVDPDGIAHLSVFVRWARRLVR
jgi:hypothetical protein